MGCFLLISASGLLSLCIRDDGVPGNPVPTSEAWMLLTVRLPQASAPATRAGEDPESEISAIRILVLENSGSGYAFSYQASGSEIEPTANIQRFRVRLNATDTPLKLMVAINAEQAFESYSPAVGTPEADIRERLELPFTAAGLSGNLPMYGELVLESGIGTGERSIQMTAIRSIARVDVVKNLEAGSDEFILEEVHIYRANDRIRLAYDALTSPDVPVVDAPSIPSGAAALGSPVSKSVQGGADAVTQIYLPESYAAAAEGDKLTETTVAVVGGRWGGEENPITYYRADFDPDLSGAKFGQLLRNHRYTFNIIEVTAPGWNTPEEAADNFASSLVVEVQAWQDFSSDMYFGENRFAISSRDIALRFVANREKRLDVESTLGYRIQWLDGNGQPTGAATSEQNVAIGNGDFSVAIVKEAGDPESVTHLSFLTLRNNHIGSVIEHQLRITVDNWSVDIAVSQDNTAVYSNLHFNVLTGIDSTYPVGNLGTTEILPTDDAFSDGGLAMRRILDVAFAPSGTIRIGGFAFEQATDSNTLLNSTTDANVQNMERIIRVQDIIYLSYEVSVSTRVAQSILQWLEEDPHRVLIAGFDTSSSNPNLRSLLTNDGSWTFTGISATNYTRAAVTAGTTDFFSGPFGTVDANPPFTKYDATLGYCASPSSSITPLIMGVNNTTSEMIFGVNKTRRIIYHGDGNLFQSGQLSGNDGNVSNNLDRLMANVWAWAVEQLIYGDD